MAINTIKATIQMRKGLERDFDADQMTAGEWAVSTDTKYVRMCFAPGIVLRMATYEGFEIDMEEIRNILKECQDIQVAVDAMAKLAEKHKSDAEKSAKLSESWAKGGTGIRIGEDRNNSKYFSDLANVLVAEAEKLLDQAQKVITASTQGALIPGGTVAFQDLPTNPAVGFMYNISNDFTTDNRFEDGAGIFYRAGANVYWTSGGKWDVLIGTQVTGVKGNAESTYRTGEVNLTPENIGLGNVDNTSDADKPISTAQRDEFNKKVNKTDIMQGSTTTTPGKAGLVPAPGTGNPDAVLKSNGTWAEGTYRSLGEVSASGWYRIFSKTTNATVGSGDTFMLTVSRGYSNTPPENFRVVCATKYNSVQWCWHTLSSMVTSSKIVDKVRAAKKGNLLYIEVHYTASVRNTISFEMLYNSGFGTFSQEPRQALNFEPATEDETVVSEYTIPDKDDFDTSKSLTRFTEIPEGANMHTYLTPGNYYCPSDARAKTLKNCPLSGAFTMVALFANGTSSYIKQIYKSYSGAQTVEVTVNNRGSWGSPNYFMYYQGTPPANKVWGTDANGNVGWIAPPLASRVAALESKSDHILVGNAELSQNGWYLLCQFTNYYTDMIIMLHKGYNESISNGVILSFSNQHNNNSESAFNILNHSGSGAIKKIAVVTYESKTYLAMNFSRTNSGIERMSSLIFWNLSGSHSVYNRNFTYIGSTPSNFTIVTEKTLST